MIKGKYINFYLGENKDGIPKSGTVEDAILCDCGKGFPETRYLVYDQQNGNIFIVDPIRIVKIYMQNLND